MFNMRETKSYEVGGHRFRVTADSEIWKHMDNYEPFIVEDDSHAQISFTLAIHSGDVPDYTELMKQEEDGQTIVYGKTEETLPVFEFRFHEVSAGCLVCSENYKEGQLITVGSFNKTAIDNALMIMFSSSTAEKHTVLFHAAAVSYEGAGYMFIGVSGTGKSTHARLWLQNISGAELVNDDNPVVRIGDDEEARVYGSPWSGKTPCYKNVSFPLKGIILLRQSPFNKICRLTGLQAYATILPSIGGIRWDKRIGDGLHSTESGLTRDVSVWLMECRPDREAAEICCATTSGKNHDRSRNY